MLDFNVKPVYQTVQLWWTLCIVANSSSTYLFILWVERTRLTKKKSFTGSSDQSQITCVISLVVDECCW